jgi:hypothetical protein
VTVHALYTISILSLSYILEGLTVLFTPTIPTISLQSYIATKDYLIIISLETVKTRISYYYYLQSTQQWSLLNCESEARIRSVYITSYDKYESNLYWITTTSFIQV